MVCWVTLLVMFFISRPITSLADDYIPVTEYYENIGIVQCPKYLNIRNQPDIEGDIVGIIKSGGVCCVLYEGDVWCAVKSGEIFGYVLRDYLLLGEEAVEAATELATKRIVFTEPGVVYSEPSVESKVWERPVTGVVYLVNSDSTEWVKVDLAGAEGYVQVSESIQKFYGLDTATKTYNLGNVTGRRASLVKYAMRFLGNKYVWGGENPNTGADCSGFVRYVYRDICPDIWIPRVSYEQCYYGEQISTLDMRPGDLLFYAYADGRVHHVAMYVGNGMIIHAASARQGIILSPWNYQTPKYVRKLLKD